MHHVSQCTFVMYYIDYCMYWYLVWKCMSMCVCVYMCAKNHIRLCTCMKQWYTSKDGFTVATGESFEIIIDCFMILMKCCWVLCLETSSGGLTELGREFGASTTLSQWAKRGYEFIPVLSNEHSLSFFEKHESLSWNLDIGLFRHPFCCSNIGIHLFFPGHPNVAGHPLVDDAFHDDVGDRKSNGLLRPVCRAGAPT